MDICCSECRVGGTYYGLTKIYGATSCSYEAYPRVCSPGEPIYYWCEEQKNISPHLLVGGDIFVINSCFDGAFVNILDA